jgi:hypothetical protein
VPQPQLVVRATFELLFLQLDVLPRQFVQSQVQQSVNPTLKLGQERCWPGDSRLHQCEPGAHLFTESNWAPLDERCQNKRLLDLFDCLDEDLLLLRRLEAIDRGPDVELHWWLLLLPEADWVKRERIQLMARLPVAGTRTDGSR